VSRFVLVHGSFHGAWCWQRLLPRLRAAGHEAEALDLPASGDDPAPADAAHLGSYVERVGEVLARQPGPVVLIGHSMGAIVCAQAAERWPERLAGVVFVCGLLLRDGETLTQFLAEFVHLGIEDQVLANMRVSDDGRLAQFPRAAAAPVFYQRCAPADAEWAADHLRPQATAVYAEPPRLTDAGFGRVRRFYVKGLDDRAVSPTYQDLMVARTPCEAVFALDTDHSPFLSAPAELAAVLDDITHRLAAPPAPTAAGTA